MTSPNGTPYFLPASSAQGLANYPHARTISSSPSTKTIYISGTSSRRGDGTYAGVSTSPSGILILDIREQTAAVLDNIGRIIKGATNGKGGLENVVDATVFLTDMKGDYGGMNEVWNQVFAKKEKAPARTTVQVAALPGEKLCVEIKCTAVVEDDL
jgi:enamine deaminase RidA (YjgF/YER057c/UK114 family)